MWGSQTELAFIWSHKTKELPVTGPGPPTAILDGRWSVGECSVSGRGGGLHRRVTTKNGQNLKGKKIISHFF